MRNTKFIQKSLDGRKRKLRAFLRSQTYGRLSDDDICEIICSLDADKQYRVKVHSDVDSFLDALVLRYTLTGYDSGSVIIGNAFLGLDSTTSKSKASMMDITQPAAAVIERGSGEESKFLHIYVPETVEEKRDYSYAQNS